MDEFQKELMKNIINDPEATLTPEQQETFCYHSWKTGQSAHKLYRKVLDANLVRGAYCDRFMYDMNAEQLRERSYNE